MSSAPARRLERSRQEIGAARALATQGFTPQAVSRAYFAAFFAAEAALLALGETRSKHSGVISAFGRLVIREGGVREEVGRLLRSLFERRNDADYAWIEVPSDEADRAVNDAELFVGAVEGWLAQGGAGSGR